MYEFPHVKNSSMFERSPTGSPGPCPAPRLDLSPLCSDSNYALSRLGKFCLKQVKQVLVSRDQQIQSPPPEKRNTPKIKFLAQPAGHPIRLDVDSFHLYLQIVSQSPSFRDPVQFTTTCSDDQRHEHIW